MHLKAQAHSGEPDNTTVKELTQPEAGGSTTDPEGEHEMLARIRKSIEEKDQGFTLIELLVVIIIIGILAAIAIPVFLNQRKKGWDSAIKSDLKNAATSQETFFTDKGYYSDTVDETTLEGFKFSADENYDGAAAITVGALYDGTGTAGATGTAAVGGFCLSADSASGATWVYDSTKGGMQPSTVTTC